MHKLVLLIKCIQILSVTCAREKGLKLDLQLEAIVEPSYRECIAQGEAIENGLAMGQTFENVPNTTITSDKVTYELYTRENAEEQTLNNSVSSIQKSNFNPRRPTTIFVPGINKTYKKQADQLKSAVLPVQDVNIFAVNWGSYAFYNATYSRYTTVPLLSAIVADFIRSLITVGLKLEDVYLIGISSGAQAIGLIGKQFNNPKIGEILAFDPVGPCYSLSPESKKLTRNDASFVTIAHCSSGSNGTPIWNRGNLTFIINGGNFQPQCLNQTSLESISFCSHVACSTYYTEVLSSPFRAIKCNTYANYLNGSCDCSQTTNLGYYIDERVEGEYYITKKSICHKSWCVFGNKL